MLEFKDLDGNELAHSHDSEDGGLDVPIIRALIAKKHSRRQVNNHVAPPEKRTSPVVRLQRLYGISLCLYDEGGGNFIADFFFPKPQRTRDGSKR